jgi:hypothetical protein
LKSLSLIFANRKISGSRVNALESGFVLIGAIGQYLIVKLMPTSLQLQIHHFVKIKDSKQLIVSQNTMTIHQERNSLQFLIDDPQHPKIYWQQWVISSHSSKKTYRITLFARRHNSLTSPIL